MKTFLTILPTLFASLFYPISKADAISVTLDNASVNSYALASGQGPFVRGTSENKALQLGAVTTSATNISPWPGYWVEADHKYATVTGLWNLTNSNAEFYFTGSINAESDGGDASASSKLTFTLTETVNYSLTGIFQQYVSAGSICTSSFTLKAVGGSTNIYSETDRIGSHNDNIGAPTYWGSGSDVASFGDGLGIIIGSNIGTLVPGTYEMEVTSGVNGGYGHSIGGSNNGSFDFVLSTPGSSVPDVGSTVALMGLALCALGGFARRFKQVSRATES